MKFSQMKYTRPDIEETKAEYLRHIEALEQASTGKDAIDTYLKADEFFGHIATMAALAVIRHSLDTTDAFYDAENNYLDENLPLLRELGQRFELALLHSPHRGEMEKRFGKLLFQNIEISLKTFTPEMVEDLQTENRLTSEYDKLIASAEIEFDGKTFTLAQLAPYHQDPDRAVRKASMLARADWFASHAAELDRLFDELVQTRHRMAQKMGYDNYIELGYYRMTRNCYDKEMVASFREGVRRYLVPLAAKLKAGQAQRLNVPGLTVYDDPIGFPSGNAKPKGTPEEIFEAGRRMYHELSPQTAEFIDFMLENELFDVLTRKGKSGGGYCSSLPDYKSPFIFANFNGTSGDIDVLTHEAGHAYADYQSRELRPSALREYTYETAEVHSMSMEFFTWPWMEGFFGDDTAKYRLGHLAGALTFIPYGTMVDEFQHEIYANPKMTPAERNALWLKLEGIYRPYLDNDFPFYGEGRRWQAQSHIYSVPFYYIDYCLAQTTALCFWRESQTDFKAAFEKYQKFVGFAGTRTFVSCIEGAELPTPFDPITMDRVAAAAAQWLETQPPVD